MKEIVTLTRDIATAYLSNPAHRVPTAGVPTLIGAIKASLDKAGTPNVPVEHAPAVDITRSVFEDRVICLHCGRQFKMLKRHLRQDHAQTPDEYRDTFGLPPAYPITAPNHSKERKTIALKMKLGHPGNRGKRR